jgi:hypothetical protein
MFVADAGIAVWVIGFLLIGLLGFGVMVVALLFRFLGWTFRAITGGSAEGELGNPLPGGRSRRLTCPHRGCGHNNDPTALFCARCGRPLRRTYDVDAYG